MDRLGVATTLLQGVGKTALSHWLSRQAMSRTGGGKEVLSTAAVAVGVGVGVAALAGLGLAGAALGAGTLLAANTSFARRAKPPLRAEDVRRDEQGRIENWVQLLKAVQHGVST